MEKEKDIQRENRKDSESVVFLTFSLGFPWKRLVTKQYKINIIINGCRVFPPHANASRLSAAIVVLIGNFCSVCFSFWARLIGSGGKAFKNSNTIGQNPTKFRAHFEQTSYFDIAFLPSKQLLNRNVDMEHTPLPAFSSSIAHCFY